MTTVEEIIAGADALPPAVSSARGRLDLRLAVVKAQLEHRWVDDARCKEHFTVLGYITHTASVQHQPGDVTARGVEPDERDLGRQGESRTSVRAW